MFRISRTAVVVFISLFVSNAFAVKLYKWEDEKGNVTYQDTPPPDGVGKVEEKDIDIEANVVPADSEGEQTASPGASGEDQDTASDDATKRDKGGLEGEALAAEEEDRLAREAEETPDDGSGDDPGAGPEPSEFADPGATAEAGARADAAATGDAAATATPATPATGGATGAAAGGTTGAGAAVTPPPLPPAAPAVGP